jgi:hypothetical protein
MSPTLGDGADTDDTDDTDAGPLLARYMDLPVHP